MKKKYLFFFLFILILPSLYSAREEINFTETFGTGEYDIYINGSECLNAEDSTLFWQQITLANLSSVSSYSADNVFYCTLGLHYDWYDDSFVNISNWNSETGEHLQFQTQFGDFNANSFGSIDFILNETDTFDIIKNQTILNVSMNLSGEEGCIAFRNGDGYDIVAIVKDTSSLWSGCVNWSNTPAEYNSNLGVSENFTHIFNKSYEDIRIMSFMAVDSTNQIINWTLDDITINFYNGSNLFPLWNFSIENQTMYKNASESASVTYTLDYFDWDNDNVFFDYQFNLYAISFKEITFSEYWTSDLWSILQAQFGTSPYYYNQDHLDYIIYPTNNECKVLGWTDLNFLFNASMISPMQDDIGEDFYLVLSGSCAGNKVLNFDLKNPFEEIEFRTQLSNLYDDGQNINITFMDITNTIEVMKFGIELEGSNYLIYDRYGGSSDLMYNLTKVNEEFTVWVDTENSSGYMVFTDDVAWNGEFNKLNSSPIRYVEYEFSGGNYDSYSNSTRLHNLGYGGKSYLPDLKSLNNSVGKHSFTITYPDFGSYRMCIFVTDQYHSAFGSYDQECYITNIFDESRNLPNAIDDNMISNIFRGFFGSFLSDLGLVTVMQSVFWLAYIFMIAIGYLITKSFTVSFLINNVMFWCFALFFGLGILYLGGMSVLVAISLAPNIVNVFVGH